MPYFTIELELARLRAVRKGSHVRSDRKRNARRDLLLEFLDLVLEQRPFVARAGVVRALAKYSNIVKVGTARILFAFMIRMVSSLNCVA